jgi:hypothetical protein
MQMYYSAETGGFYSPAVHGKAIPVDAVALSTVEYGEVLGALNTGKKVTMVDGKLVLSDPPAPPPPTRAQQEALRQAAYVSEADPIAMQMLRDEATKEEWLAKIDEIKARYPYPEESAQ